jgi:hypothetical protein
MSTSILLALDAAMASAIDERAAELSTTTGLRCTRTDIVRIAVRQFLGLDVLSAKGAKPKRKPPTAAEIEATVAELNVAPNPFV